MAALIAAAVTASAGTAFKAASAAAFAATVTATIWAAWAAICSTVCSTIRAPIWAPVWATITTTFGAGTTRAVAVATATVTTAIVAVASATAERPLETGTRIAADARGVSREIFARAAARAARFTGKKDRFFALRRWRAGICGGRHGFGIVMRFVLILRGDVVGFVVSGVGFRFG